MDFEVAKNQERTAGVWDHYFLISKPSALNSPPDARVFSFFSFLFLPLPQHVAIMTRFQAHNHAHYLERGGEGESALGRLFATLVL